MATSVAERGIADNIGLSVQFLLDCKEKGRQLGNRGLPSIFMVPNVIRDLSPISFKPRMVCIGPLHRQDKGLQEFEVQKTTYLHRFLDGLGSNPQKNVTRMYAKGPFPGNMLISPSITFDLLLIENQIPFFVLQDIFESTILQFNPTASLTKHMQILLGYYNILGAKLVKHVTLETNADHILGLLHKAFRPAHDIPSGFRTNPKRHSAVELDRAGVNFTSYKDVNWAMAMKLELLPRFSYFPWFWRKLTLRMPKLYVDDRTERVLRNLIIYEQSSIVPNFVTAYAWTMGMLIDAPEDVAKLVKSGVLMTISSNANVLNMIYNICKEVVYDDFFYYQEWQQLDSYYNSYWPNAVAGLKLTYFSSPWNIIALFAGIVLFVLTVVQTIFTIMSAFP